jgi:Putative DNA-binding domain
LSAVVSTIGIVALGIDTARAFRFYDEIVRLVEAVVAANSEDESTWIEWKGPLDLRHEPAFHRLPRNILGFANRDPAGAAHHAEGYAYLIIGAEPGAVPGIDPIDSGDLTARLRAYVGDKITWHSQYVTVQGKHVLVITVDPPRAGDSIHPLRKQMQSIQAGEIFIRLGGQTSKARSEHIEMLEQRCKASASQLSISVSPLGGARIERPADPAPEIEPRLARTRKRLLEATPKPPQTSWNSGRVRLSPEIASSAEAAAAEKIRKYLEDVELYLNEWARAMRLRHDILQSGHSRSALTLLATNNTDRNYLAVQVSAFVPGVRCLDLDDLQWPALPNEPTPPSMVSDLNAALSGLVSLHGLGRIPNLDAPVTAALAVPVMKAVEFTPRPTKKPVSGGLLLEYPEIHLRPRQEVLLQSVPLLVLTETGSTIAIEWEATAQNADGKLDEVLTMTVQPSTLYSSSAMIADAE